MAFRTENDYIGSMEIPAEALYGIHSLRARQNFPDTTRFHAEWYKAIGNVKLACYLTYRQYSAALNQKYGANTIPIKLIPEDILKNLIKAAEEVRTGKYFDQFIVPAISGGAGTSMNMNVNEIISNAALLHQGSKPGEYKSIDPIEHANIFQSTNDVIPTALKVAVMQQLKTLEEEINKLRQSIEKLEKKYRNHLRVGFTQMQEAVPTSYGRLFGTYNEALSRDWWRVSKCWERIKVVNLGGSAIGTGLTVPRYFIMEVVQNLQRITELPVTRSENMSDATSNLDSFVEVHAILKAHSVNLEKMVSDIRLLSSDFSRLQELKIPQKQVGSTIMPGKINPVIPEFVISVAHKVYTNDSLIASLAGQGCLELNAYLPTLGHSLLESLKLLIAANKTLRENLIEGIELNEEKSLENVSRSPSITTVLLPYIGYHKASELAKVMKEKGCDLFEANKKVKALPVEKLRKILDPQFLLKEGFTLDDITSILND